MPLVLVTDTNPGSARWEDSGIIGGGGDSLALILEVDPGDGPAPVIDPAGRSNIFYIFTGEGTLEVTLPEITPTLNPTWRIAGNGTIQVFHQAGDNWAGGGASTYIQMSACDSIAAMTFVHDGVDTWALFEAGCNTYQPL